jgi:hypothetical protein
MSGAHSFQPILRAVRSTDLALIFLLEQERRYRQPAQEFFLF